ncbi:MAG: DUF1579 domain-containing protein [Desulfobacteraceae bacterium]|nr:MAG: DUF1579 domain-containing protein [Desulfobacteraceae bacterium]
MVTEKEGKMDMQAQMEIHAKMSQPGASHKLLESMEGSWTAKTTTWMEPGQPPVESASTSENQMILGGRYLHQEFSGDMMGTPFKGIGINGYDNFKKKFVSIWMDSMSTGIFYFEGEGQGKTITQVCHAEDPVKGPVTWRSITRIEDHNTHKFEMFGTDKSGKEEKMMEIIYTRRR